MLSRTAHVIQGYPPQHWQALRHARCRAGFTLLLMGAVAGTLSLGFVNDWPHEIFALAPYATAFFLFLLVAIRGLLRDMRTVRVLPYFRKGDAKVQGDTFLSGLSLAQNCVYLDALAADSGLESLSSFGFADDLNGERLTWYDAGRGLETCVRLLFLLRQNPHQLPDSGAVINDLCKLETCLRSAYQLEVQFCLLLRHGNYTSGHEMDVRQGTFCYGNPTS